MSRAISSSFRHRWRPGKLSVVVVVIGLLLGPIALVQSAPEMVEWQESASEESARARLEEDLTGEPPLPSNPAWMNNLAQALDGLNQRLKTLKTVGDGVEDNRQAIVDLGERLEAELKRVDPITLRLDSVAEQVQQITNVIDNHQTRIEDNSVKLYETLLGIETARQQLDEVREAQRRAQLAASEDDARRAIVGSDDRDLRLLLSVALCMLVPFAVLLYQGGLGGMVPAENAATPAAVQPAPAAWIVPAWLGGGVGYYLLGFGIMFGASQGGWIGSPVYFFSELLLSAPADAKPELLTALISQTLLAGIAGVIVCSGSVDRLSPWGHLFTALIVGGFLYPIFGHWTSASHLLSDQQGWLSSAGYVSSAGTAGLGLLAGIAALSLAGGLGRPGNRSREGQPPEPIVTAALGAVLLWIAWPGVIIAASTENPSLPALLLASSMAVAAAGLSVLVFDGLFSADPRWLQRVPGAALVGLVAAPGAYTDASSSDLLLLGLLAGLSYILVMRQLSKRSSIGLELAAIFAAGGLWGTLAPALFGADGFLFVQSIDRILPQLQGVGTALALAMVVGRLLAWPARHMALLRART